ncbi:restriction endonuclease subunit S [Moraxella catarrhalis]|uniref:restriction endonuclease subunit S n=2 Tax=Moraxella catarrhalis TaxID=480 RepID=UPI00128C835E|nr:restriction endonuclease subunit S [Moraxella catarrhalis]MPW99321.1 restriction endonuclease subunit S [Moraxella catarrhalis]
MAQHSFLQNLLQGQAVEWKTLGEVAVIGTGNSNRQDESENGDYPFYVRSKNVLRSDSYQFDETAIVIPGEGGVGDIFHYVEGKYALHQRAYRICIHDGDINTKFLYHVMRNSFKQYILSKSVGATATSIRKPMLEKFLIPIPPLSVQAKIVQILDTFTELTEQLTAELGMRQKQYQYYRNKLLTFDFEAVQSLATASDSERQRATASDSERQRMALVWKTLGEVGELIRGNGLTKKDLTDDGVPAIHYGQIYTRYGLSTEKTLSFVSTELAKRLRKVDTGDVVITNTSENLADVGKSLVYLGKEQAVTGGHATIFKPNKQIILGKYFAYFTQTDNFATQKRKYAKGTKVIDVSTNDMAKLKIPIPPLSEQARIVTILDTFDTLVNSISNGLPKEIQLRQRQYEYYRNVLLGF